MAERADAAGHPGAAAAVAARAGVPRAARRARRRLRPGRRLRRARAAGRARPAAARLGQPALLAAARPGGEPRRSSTRSWPATRSPAPRRSGWRPGSTPARSSGRSPRPIGPRDTAGDLLGRLAVSGAGLLVATLDGIEAGTLVAEPQPADGISLAPQDRDRPTRGSTGPCPPTSSTGGSAGCTPAPGAWTTWRGDRLRLGPGRAGARGRPGWRRASSQCRARAVCSSGTGRGAVRLGRGAAGRQADAPGRRLGARRPPAARRAAGRVTRPAPQGADGIPRPARRPLDGARLTAYDVLDGVSSRGRLRQPAAAPAAARTARARRARRRVRHPARLRHAAGAGHAGRRPRPALVSRPLAELDPRVLDLLRLGRLPADRPAGAVARRRRHHRRPHPGDRGHRRLRAWSTPCCARSPPAATGRQWLARLGGDERPAARAGDQPPAVDRRRLAGRARRTTAELEAALLADDAAPEVHLVARRMDRADAGRGVRRRARARGRRSPSGCTAATRAGWPSVRSGGRRGAGRGQPAGGAAARPRAAGRARTPPGWTCAPARAARPGCWPPSVPRACG